MLLRSASTPILKSWIPLAKEPLPEPNAGELVPNIPKARSVTHLHPSISFSSSSSSPSPGRLTRAMSENDLLELLSPPPKRKPFTATAATRGMMHSISLEEEIGNGEEGTGEGEENSSSPSSFDRLLSSLGLDDASSVVIEGCCTVGAECSRAHVATLVVSDGCVGDGSGGGGKIFGGGGGRGRGSDGGGFGFSDPNKSTDAYYQKMIQADPGNSLILGNYAKFLKEVRGDLIKAEEYCERAILANQGDGSALSMYADLIWEKSKDAQRAENYFDRAVQAAPKDCYVMASYARFLWDAEEEGGVHEGEGEGEGKEGVNRTPPPLFPGEAPPSSIAAASSEPLFLH